MEWTKLCNITQPHNSKWIFHGQFTESYFLTN